MVIDAAVADAVLKRFDGLGVRGIYFNLAPSNEAMTATMIEPLARRIATLGWHVEIDVWAADLLPLLPVLQRLPTPVVLDRFGHVREPEGPDHPLFAQIRQTLPVLGWNRSILSGAGPGPCPRRYERRSHRPIQGSSRA